MNCDSWLIPFAILIIGGLASISTFLLGRIPMLFARRYIFPTGKRNAINIITSISLFGITFVTAALILILSIFNGFHFLISDMFGKFDAQLRASPTSGKVFQNPDSVCAQLRSLEGVALSIPVIENKVLVKYFDKRHIAVLKGMKPERKEISPIESSVYNGEYRFENENGFPLCVMGSGVASALSATLKDYIHPIEVYAISGKANLLSNPEEALHQENFLPAGFFQVQMEYDNKYVLVDYDLAEKLFEMEGEASAIEIKLKEGYSPEKMKPLVSAKLGESFAVFTAQEQHETLYKVMQNEKLLSYLLVTLVLLLSAVNVIGSLSMIVLEKSKDIGVSRAFGTPSAVIAKVFLGVGLLMGLISAGSGLVIGLGVGLLKENYGLVKISGGDSFIIQAYPLKLCPLDFILVFLTVLGLCLVAAWYPARKAARLRIVDAIRK